MWLLLRCLRKVSDGFGLGVLAGSEDEPDDRHRVMSGLRWQGDG